MIASPLGYGVNSGMVVNITCHIYICPGSKHILDHTFTRAGTYGSRFHSLFQISVHFHI